MLYISINTIEMMILIVIVAIIVGSAAVLLSGKLDTMSQHVDDTLTQVQQDIMKQNGD